MARVTVEDCVTVVPNRFELCLLASNRAKSILSGVKTTLDRREKTTVIALREIADGLANVEKIRSSILSNIKNKRHLTNLIMVDDVCQSIDEETEDGQVMLTNDLFSEDNVVVDD